MHPKGIHGVLTVHMPNNELSTIRKKKKKKKA